MSITLSHQMEHLNILLVLRDSQKQVLKDLGIYRCQSEKQWTEKGNTQISEVEYMDAKMWQ